MATASGSPPPDERSTAGLRHFVTLLGAGAAALALLWNPWTVGVLHPREPLPPEALQRTLRAELALLGLAAALVLAARLLPARRRAARIVLAPLLAVAFVLALEQMLSPFVEGPTTLFQRDAELGWRLRPGAEDYWGGLWTRINAQGLRGPVRDHARRAGVPRVLFLGDSVTFGFLIEDDARVLTARAEERLRARLGGEVECINAAVGGWSPWQELSFLRREGARYQPDLVVLGFVLNDVTEQLRLVQFGGEWEGEQLERSRSESPLGFLLDSSIALFARRLRARMEYGSDVQEGARRAETLSIWHLILEPNRDDVQAAWRQTQRSVDGIVDWCGENGASLLLVMFPVSAQLERPELRAPQWIMESFARRRDVSYLDLLPPLAAEMRARDVTEADLMIDAVHPSELGHEWIGRIVADAIVERGLLRP